ncbi:tRNA (adenosine(37)-N6)-threonylcarbamoyltransferase complex ATPase subunit type 1 TsaE [Mycoplasmopsis iners]|uniref:tRNA (adenosine(37)-N6)-threonylcarbamoyltransferase complex ATPase subunit type 1 TsaE n=1 Tax=Mycoplasmopsis iners TaxID=76630 RepID=UPI0004952443|nr:tRNA (adenosine(37)-N6)-threonylcarbamoyltransferase complex ATPase subunit type 1 TsaE [Mycoplasmopsis iners]
MKKEKIIVRTLDDLSQVAKFTLDNLTSSKKVLLNGDLGAGKTALVKKIAEQIGIKQPITSPTFNYMKVYDGLVHIDAYNLTEDLSEFEDFFDNNIVAIEWANNITIYDKNYLEINIEVDTENNRIYTITKEE